MNKLPELKELPTQELVDKLTAERDALAAQVEQLKLYIVALTHADETGYVDDVGFVENFAEIETEIKTLVAEHDAEVAAKAVEDALRMVYHEEDDHIGYYSYDAMAHYANQLSQQANGGE